jgi:hypothetical protein
LPLIRPNIRKMNLRVKPKRPPPVKKEMDT